jgi:hypothetical protein
VPGFLRLAARFVPAVVDVRLLQESAALLVLLSFQDAEVKETRA